MTKKLKNAKLRHNEYYDMQNVFDGLHQSSADGKIFNNLMQYITCESNIKLAYRNIKKNAGSHTMGADLMTIKNIESMEINDFVQSIQRKFANYQPKAVMRVEIPKEESDKTKSANACQEVYRKKIAINFSHSKQKKKARQKER